MRQGVLGRFMEQRQKQAIRRSRAVAAAVAHVAELDASADGLTAPTVLQLTNRYRTMLTAQERVPGTDRGELEDLRKVIDVLDSVHRALQV